ncbi:MAG: archaeosine biosynthesis radical SAM protein RaSEA [Methanobacteriaceae archaeon]|jgi:radical SAM enzyme (TIGR01210 family)|nr:archaeosine biosynthesis radical SAM protein RaSEA [Candidatus Methanorudis spinitermitis]
MEIQKLTKEIRDNFISKQKKRKVDDLATSWFQDDLLYSGSGKSIFLILPTPGCAWALGESGGCSMCSYITDCTLEPIESEKIVKLFKREITTSMEKIRLENDDSTPSPIAIKIFASGSFLNPMEVSKDARDEILDILANMDEIKEIIVESRPEYIKSEVLNEIFSIIGDKLFEVSIGLESENDSIREEKINKGFNKKDFELAISKINKAKNNYSIKSKAYVLVKPILTTEKEAIEDAINTAKYCESIGVDRISFCPATIHKGTLIERLWRKGAYTPPWIWTTVEIINEVRKNIAIPSFMDTSGFGSRRGPYNCKKCNKDLKHMIIQSNLNQSLIEEIDCKCKNQWKSEVKFSDLNKSKTPIKHLPLI